MKTVADVLSEMKVQFREAGVHSPDADARILVQHALHMTREELFLNSNQMLAEDKVKLLDEYTARRVKREPVSRITGQRAFWKSDFKIGAETLDPRPDSEVVIEAALKHCRHPRLVRGSGSASARHMSQESQDGLTAYRIPAQGGDDDCSFGLLDLGTGTGCLLLSLLQEWPQAFGIGVDISQGAADTARENAAALNLSNRAEFICGDWNTLKFDHMFDVIISNPPYISEEEMKTLEPEVTLYDPRRALVAGEGGLACYRDIIALLPRLLRPEGYVFFEIGHTQAKAVKDLLEQGGFTVLETVQDLAGSDRCIAAGFKSPGLKSL